AQLLPRAAPRRPEIRAEPGADPLPPGLLRRAPVRPQGQSAEARDPPPRRRRAPGQERRAARARRDGKPPVAGHGAGDRTHDSRRSVRVGVAGGLAVERTLAVMCGAGVLPALVAERARAERWRVVAFTFDGATDLSARVARTIPSRLREFGPILTGLKDEGVSAAVLVGRFSMTDVLHTRPSTADQSGCAAGR